MKKVKRVYYRYSLARGIVRYPSRLWIATDSARKSTVTIAAAALLATYGVFGLFGVSKPAANFTVPGENYEICNEGSTYLSSPWTYDATTLPTGMGSPGSGAEAYSITQYEAIAGYGTTLPPLPSYIANEPNPSTTEAAVIYQPGSTATEAGDWNYPNSPIINFFEGGNYSNPIALDSVSGDEFIGGYENSTYPEPEFNDQGQADGIDAQNGSYDFSGGEGTLSQASGTNTNVITTTAPIPGYLEYVNFADGTSYGVVNVSGDTITLSSDLTQPESSGTAVWASRSQPVAFVASGASTGATSVTLTSSSIPFMQYATADIGGSDDIVASTLGSQTGYTLTITGGLDTAVAAGTPVYYDGNAGDVTVEYLNIDNDQHNTTGTIYTGTGEGWTIEHNDIHDGYSGGPGFGVALYGGGEGTIEYNCLSKMGDYGINAFGTNTTFDYNEIYESNYEADPGCGCSGGGKWWGTLNANIVDNAFIGNGYGGGGAIWFDNGNSGSLVEGNYFDQTYGQAISDETGFNADITDNLFQDDNWGSGTGCGNTNCTGDVSLNTSGGTEVPGSRYEDQMTISGNEFLNDWGGVGIWQSGSRSCENSGESYKPDAPYCSGGYPNSAANDAAGDYYFSHEGDVINGQVATLEANASSGSSTVLVNSSQAIDDYIDFTNPATATTSDTTNVTTFTGSGTIHVGSTSGFPSTGGQLYVTTSSGNAILSYSATTATTFTGVQLISDPDVSDTGTLSGTIQVNDPAYTNTTATSTNVTSFTGTQSLATVSTEGFPSSGQLRVGTSTAWSDTGGSYTGAILSYGGISGNNFTDVNLVSGSGTVGGGSGTPIMEVLPYHVTSETCYANDCAVHISPSLSSNIVAGDNIPNSGTCQVYADSTATPTSPMDPALSNSPYYESYWDGCQWEARNVSITGNTFILQPSVMDATAPLTGGTTSCTAGNSCGTNFMSDQPSGELPFDNQIGANAMMSSTTFSGCPTGWDASCHSDPLTNLNALSTPPGGAPANNGEAPYNDVWSDNAYTGTWTFNAFIYGNCSGSMPTDPTTGDTMSTAACTASFSQWQNDWQQDQGSTQDTTAPPTTPNNVSATADGPSSITVSWSTSDDTGGPGIGGYYVYRNGAQVGNVTSGTSYLDSGLSANTQYSYTVEAYDTADPPDVSAASSTATATTSSTGSPPTVNITSPVAEASLYGPAAAVDATITPNGGATITQAQLLVNGTSVQTLTSSPYDFSFSTTSYADGSYTLAVKATDSNNNTTTTPVTVDFTNGSLTGNGQVGLSDLIILGEHYGQSGTFTYAQGNMTGATTPPEVNLSDLIILGRNYGYNDGLGH